MSDLHFFTPITYGTLPKTTSQSLLEATDAYFYLGGKRAYVIAGRVEQGKEGVLLLEESSSFVVSALKVASYFTIVIPLLVLVVKIALRSMHKVHLIDARAELGGNLDVGDSIKAKVQQLMPVIEKEEDHPQIQWLSKKHTRVFRLVGEGDPQFVFKVHTVQQVSMTTVDGRNMDGAQQVANRFENMIQAKPVCLAHQLDLIKIPHAKMFTVEASNGKVLPVIVEQSLPVRATESAQEEIYRDRAQGLSRAVLQLTTFIAKTGFNDVTWRNIPVPDDVVPLSRDLPIALIDFDHMESAKEGILGSGNGSCGLVRCLFLEEQIDAVLAEARRQGIITLEEAQATKARRMEEIRSSSELLAFYRRNGILENHRKPLAVDVSTLGLDLNETTVLELPSFLKNAITGEEIGSYQRRFTMRQVVEGTVTEINKLIQATKEGESVKGKRDILLNTHNHPFDQYNKLGGYEESTSWLHRIIRALVAKGHLFRLVKHNGHGFFIQA